MFTTHLNPYRQKGVSIVTAIFLIVVLALMGLGMVSILTTSQQSISQEITSAKAYMASRSCLQWAMYQAVYDPDPWLSSPDTVIFNNSGLVNTGCTTTFNTITNDGKTFFNIEAKATYGSASDPEFSQRTFQLQFIPK
jgi:MSHA biogenesis protein MshP